MRYPYIELAQGIAQSYPPPRGEGLDAWTAWGWEHLRVFTRLTDRLPPSHLAVARLEAPPVRGSITMNPRVTFPQLLWCHELGHIMVGQDGMYTLAWSDADRTHARIKAEQTASNFAVALLLDEHEVQRRLLAGQQCEEVACALDVTVGAVARMALLLGIACDQPACSCLDCAWSEQLPFRFPRDRRAELRPGLLVIDHLPARPARHRATRA
jgi:hypothetical protein